MAAWTIIDGVKHCYIDPQWIKTDTDQIVYGKEGDQVSAHFSDFVSLAESPAGFGDTEAEAKADLLKDLVYTSEPEGDASKMSMALIEWQAGYPNPTVAEGFRAGWEAGKKDIAALEAELETWKNKCNTEKETS